MKETCEFRIPEDRADLLFGPDEGQRLGGTVRKVILSTDDPRYIEVGRINESLLRNSDGKRSFFNGWVMSRQYTNNEINSANIFKCRPAKTFEPAGEECGTAYDESTACPKCGSGARQTTPLHLRISSIPKSMDICRTIAGEVVVSRRLVDAFLEAGISGIEFKPILSTTRSGKSENLWFQFTGKMAEAEISEPTRTGNAPFNYDERNEYRCPLGHLVGLNLLSEVYIKNTRLNKDDLFLTRQFVGMRSGLLRPERIMLVTPRLREIVVENKLKGFEFEVAHLV